MKGGKPISSPLGNHFKLIKKSCPNSNDEKKKMKSIIPYSFVVGSLMYAMLCTRTDIAHTIRVVSRFLSNLEKEHWEVVKWIFRYLTSSSSVSCVMEEFKHSYEGLWIQTETVTLIVGATSSSSMIIARGAMS